jgi:two-component system CheB/CheR fusion protein
MSKEVEKPETGGADGAGQSPTSGELVVVGSSAGGIEALSILVGAIPSDFPAPIVLAQHLDVTRPSNLDVILRRRSNLPVEVVTSRSKLEVGKIYVVPSNRHVTIKDSYVEVQEDQSKRVRPRPSVDALFSSAAEVYGERLIAVILTGSGSDGAAGAVDVKNAGGTVIVQNPQTARYPSMPLALPPTIVDFETDLEQIGPLLYDLLSGVHLPRSEERTEDVLHSILERVNRQASIDFHAYKTSTILRRISRRMAVTRSRTMREYHDYLYAHPEEVGELVKAFLINVTQFFRDPEAFAYLRSEILPRLIAQARYRDRVLRFWAAGCATGEEPYSLAMLLTDLLGAELPEWSVKIFATDVDEAAINFARRGLYSENLLKSVPPEYRERFFERVDQGYRISKTLRQMVIFGQQDLSRSAPFPRIDLVLCRNVLIYFTPELQEYVLNQFAFSLSPNGYLFLGKAETVRPTQSFYELVNKHWKVYRCTGNALPMTRRQSLSELSTPRLDRGAGNVTARSGGKQLMEQEQTQPAFELGQLRRLNELLLRFLPIGIVVINRSYHVLTANGTARRLLGLRELGNEHDFLHSVRGIPYTTVRNTIDTVFRERSSVTLPEVELDITGGGNGRFLTLSIALMQMESGSQDLAIISVSDVTEQVQTRRQLESAQAEQAQLMNELSASNKRLNDVNKELMDANEELQVANEELVLTHEELQASIEEFETTNEELQATNEELETNNEELQATNEELETTNEELRARTGELQELASMLESERVRLSEIAELAPFYILVLRGPALLVEAFNPRYARLLEGRAVQGHPLDEVFDHFWEGGHEVVRLAHETFLRDEVRTTPPLRTALPGPRGVPVEGYLVYTIVPSHDINGRVSGVIIYAADETAQIARGAAEQLQRLKLVLDNASAAALALYDVQTTELLMGSPRYLEIVAQVHNLPAASLIGRPFQDIALIASPEEASRLWNAALENQSPVHRSEVYVQVPMAENSEESIWNWTLTPIMDTERPGTVRFMLVSAVEITEEVQARQEVERLNRVKDEFLSLASHELLTPLTAMLGQAQRLLHRLEQARSSTTMGEQKKTSLSVEEQRQALESIIQQIRRMSRLIDEMRDLTRIRGELFQLNNRENVDIVALVRHVIEQHEAGSRRRIKLESGEEHITGTWDEARVEQVLNNLLSNALKYSPAETPVTVGIERRDNEVVVRVRDEGPGIQEEQQAHIFDRFYRIENNGEQLQVEGLGLGLYIAHEIVRLQGGRIWLESKEGQGSTFFFSLPLNPQS